MKINTKKIVLNVGDWERDRTVSQQLRQVFFGQENGFLRRILKFIPSERRKLFARGENNGTIKILVQ